MKGLFYATKITGNEQKKKSLVDNVVLIQCVVPENIYNPHVKGFWVEPLPPSPLEIPV